MWRAFLHSGETPVLYRRPRAQIYGALKKRRQRRRRRRRQTKEYEIVHLIFPGLYTRYPNIYRDTTRESVELV